MIEYFPGLSWILQAAVCKAGHDGVGELHSPQRQGWDFESLGLLGPSVHTFTVTGWLVHLSVCCWLRGRCQGHAPGSFSAPTLRVDWAIDVALKAASDIRASGSPHGRFTARAGQGRLQPHAGHRGQDHAGRAGVTGPRGEGRGPASRSHADIWSSCLLPRVSASKTTTKLPV